jgi:excinuclease ABC subunit C
MTPEIEERIATLPTKPGVYQFKAARGEIIYVGKATNLRSRVRSYFGGNDHRPFVALLDTLLVDIEVIVTQNAKEALLLENTLIKRHKPRFNVMLRDDKNYLSMRIDRRHKWPRVEIVRTIRNDGAHYFGPFHSAQAARRTLNVLNRHFQLRTCRDSVFANRSRPCLQYQIKRCPGPCVLQVDRSAYMEDVQRAEFFLSGREHELANDLEQRMVRAADDLEFEIAARYRDMLSAVREALQPQQTIQTSLVDRDVIGMHREAEYAVFAVSTFRKGALNDVSTWSLKHQTLPDDEVVGGFLGQFYGDTRKPPAEVLVSHEPAAIEELADALSELRGSRCTVLVPQRGTKMRLLELATENARQHFADTLSSSARAADAADRLQERLGLRNTPRTIECFDISNFQGREIVASQVAFLDGQPDREGYRRYRIKLSEGQDDFASMYETILRRAKRSQAEDRPLPDLMLIDGGKGQLNAALAALQDARITDQDIVSIAKSRLKGHEGDDAIRTDERIFVPGRKDPVVLRQSSEEMHLLERLRDEAHRVAITFHRELRDKARLRSPLSDIPGIGPARVKALLTHFGSLKKVRAASLADIEAVAGFERALAWRVYDHLHPGEADPPTDTNA